MIYYPIINETLDEILTNIKNNSDINVLWKLGQYLWRASPEEINRVKEFAQDHKGQLIGFMVEEVLYDRKFLTQMDRTAAYKIYQNEAHANDARAMTIKAVYLFGKYGDPRDEESAVKLLVQCSGLGQASAKRNLAQYYQKMNNLKDFEKLVIFTLYKEAALSGSAVAQIQLGDCYQKGEGVEQDYVHAAQLYQVAMLQGCPFAYVSLGNAYAKGQGVEQDFMKARELFETAAARGDTRAVFLLGTVYEDKKSPFYDMVQAVKFYEKAAALTDPRAVAKLSTLVRKDYPIVNEALEDMLTHIKEDSDVNATWKLKQYLDKASPEEVNRIKEFSAQNADSMPGFIVDEVLLSTKKIEKMNKSGAYMLYDKAQKTDARAMNIMGLYYLGKDSHYKDEKRAIELFTKSAELGNASAQRNLATYYNKLNAPENFERMIALYREAALCGHALAQADLATCYATAKGVIKDDGQAARLYEIAVKQGCVRAYRPLSCLYMEGLGVPQDIAKAMALNETAAKLGDSAAQADQGSRFEQQADWKEAVKWYQLSADQNNVYGLCGLGKLYRDGHGVERDCQRAKEFFENAAEQNHVDAQFLLGKLYEDKRSPLYDRSKAREWYEKAAEQNHARAQCRMAVHYGLNNNFPKMVTLFFAAAQQNNAYAQYALGRLYAEGKGVDRDFTKMLTWYQKAANQDSAAAKYHLGLCYIQGTGVVQDRKTAFFWFKSAAELNYAPAICFVAAAYWHGEQVPCDKEQGKKYYEKALYASCNDSKLMHKILQRLHCIYQGKDCLAPNEYYARVCMSLINKIDQGVEITSAMLKNMFDADTVHTASIMLDFKATGAGSSQGIKRPILTAWSSEIPVVQQGKRLLNSEIPEVRQKKRMKF